MVCPTLRGARTLPRPTTCPDSSTPPWLLKPSSRLSPTCYDHTSLSSVLYFIALRRLGPMWPTLWACYAAQ
eukprot:4637345-Pleurochrysis_carterae.AAC.1